MKSVVAASALALMASTSAFATDYDADIGQFARGIQNALNEIKNVTDADLVDQDAVNAANLVSKVNADKLTAVYQKSTVDQNAKNVIRSSYFLPVDVSSATQDATNVANSVSFGQVLDNGNVVGDADFLEEIRQYSRGDQTAINEIKGLDDADTVGQTAVNAANLISLEVDAGVIDDVSQKSYGDQIAKNTIETSYIAYFPEIETVTQSATNVANSISLGKISLGGKMLDDTWQDVDVSQFAQNKIETVKTAEDVSQAAVNAANLISSVEAELGDVHQFAYGKQEALNSIRFKEWIDGNATDGGEVVPAAQSATNVINSVSAPVINKTLFQFSNVMQKAENVAVSVNGSLSSNIWDFDQTAVNAANLVSIGVIGGDLELDQVAFVSQNASNLIDANGTVQAVVQSATNVANSVGDLN